MNMLEAKFTSIMSKSSTDVRQTNLHTLDVQVTEGSPVFIKQYTIPLKYQNFIDDKTKRLEEAGLISRSLNNWSALCMVARCRLTKQDNAQNGDRLQTVEQENLNIQSARSKW